MGQDFPGTDGGKDYPERDDISVQSEGQCVDARHGLTSLEDGVQIKPWHLLPLLMAPSHLLCQCEPHTQTYTHASWYLGLSQFQFSCLRACKLHPSVGVTNRPLPPHLTAHDYLPSGQWAISPHSPITCHENGYQFPQKMMLVAWLEFTSLIRDPLWVTLLVRSPQMSLPCTNLPGLSFLR